MVHLSRHLFFSPKRMSTKGCYSSLSLHCRLLPVQNVTRKLHRPIGKTPLRSHPTQSKKRKDMSQHVPVPPIANVIRNAHIRPIVLSKAIPNKSRRHGSTTINRLRQQPAMKLQQPAPITRRPLRKKHHRQPCIHRRLHSLPSLHRRPAMPPRNINSSRHRRHPTHHRPALDLSLGDKHARMHRRIHHNVHITQVIRNYSASFRKVTQNADLNIHPAHRSRAETVQPISSLFSRLRLCHRQFGTSPHEHSHQPNTPPHSPKKTHQIKSSLAQNRSLLSEASSRSLSCQQCNPANPISTPTRKSPPRSITTGSTAASRFPSSHCFAWERPLKNLPGASPSVSSSALTLSSEAPPFSASPLPSSSAST
jgi:hypothetical protein